MGNKLYLKMDTLYLINNIFFILREREFRFVGTNDEESKRRRRTYRDSVIVEYILNKSCRYAIRRDIIAVTQIGRFIESWAPWIDKSDINQTHMNRLHSTLPILNKRELDDSDVVMENFFKDKFDRMSESEKDDFRYSMSMNIISKLMRRKYERNG